MVRVRLMDGDRIMAEIRMPDPPPAGIVLPRASDDGRCVCTKPARKLGHFCAQTFRKREIAEDGVQVYRIAARAKATKLAQPMKATTIA